MSLARHLGLSLALLSLWGCGPGAEVVGELSAVTYNVQGLPEALTDSDRPNDERMSAIAAGIERFDIVALQEDFDLENHQILTDTSHPERRWFHEKFDESRIYGAGLTLLSRFEETSYFEEHYLECHGIFDSASDCLASKGFQRMTIRIGAQELDIYNTHHEAGGGELDIQARESQVDQVIAAMEARPDTAVLFLGDMNLRPSRDRDAEGLRRYRDAGLRHACTEDDCPEPDHIDQIYVRDGAALRLQVAEWHNLDLDFRFDEGDPMSDHPPIKAVIRWEIP